MRKTFVRDFRPNQDVTTTFLVQSKEIRQKRSGEPYLSLTLVDKTGEIDAKMWDNVAEAMHTFDRNDFIQIKGRVQVFQNRPQLTIHKLLRIDEAELSFADFFPASERDPDEMFAELLEIIQGIGDPHLRALLGAVFDDPEIAERYRRAPAAKSIHHAYLGGLLEHALSLCRLCRATAEHYRFVDLDLLLTGAVLHDIGKLHELTYQRSFGYSDDGQMLGHIVIGLRMIDDKLRTLPEFPPRLRTLIEHMVASHHGTLEFGSPKVPLFPEAMLLHFLDNLDSKMENMRATIEKDQRLEGCWTGYSPPLDRHFLKKDRYLNPEQHRKEPEPPSPPRAEKPPAQPRPTVLAEKLNAALKRDS
jgi:3'-5' exoribonuclease